MKPIGWITIIVLSAGAAGTGAWFFTKRKYVKQKEEELESMREVMRHRFAEEKEVKNTTKVAESKSYIKEPLVSPSEDQLKAYTSRYKAKEDPREIDIEDFGEEDGYDTITFTYYDDNVLANEDDEEVIDPETYIGKHALDSFSNPDVDSKYFRNDKLKTDFEVLRSMKTYEEVLEEKPYLKE